MTSGYGSSNDRTAFLTREEYLDRAPDIIRDEIFEGDVIVDTSYSKVLVYKKGKIFRLPLNIKASRIMEIDLRSGFEEVILYQDQYSEEASSIRDLYSLILQTDFSLSNQRGPHYEIDLLSK